ncbi:MAG: DUF2062 domain-containing protein [Bacteroidales bacterium]|nr:DUF2062 domain-containing protein [Bacteroidales bacterium]
MEQQVRDILEKGKVAIIMPTYNNAPKLKEVFEQLDAYRSWLIVVNDGCTDDSDRIIKAFSPLEYVIHAQNKGKGKALQTGFKKAVELGFEYAITMDSDGQHFATDIPKFLPYTQKETTQLVVGARNMTTDNIPGKSSFGHKFSNFWYWAETGIRLPDTQSGFRLYPLQAISNMSFFTKKFEFEIEVIVRLAWQGVEVGSVPIKVEYTEDRISHFRPFKDFFRISVLNTVLFLMAILWMLPMMFFRRIRKKGLKNYLLDLTLNSNHSSLRLAISAGFGVFMGIVPIWGYQLASAIGLAYLFRLNKPIVILTANISIPPFTLLIIYMSYVVGAWFTGGSISINFQDITMESVKDDAMQYLVGAIVLSILSGLLTTFISLPLFKYWRKKYSNR